MVTSSSCCKIQNYQSLSPSLPPLSLSLFLPNSLSHYLVVPEVMLQNLSSTEPIEGDPIALTCSISGGWPRIGQIQWLKDGTPINASADPRVTIDTLPMSMDAYGLYSQTSNLTIAGSRGIEDSGIYTCRSYLTIPDFPMVSKNISILVLGMLQAITYM